MKTNSGYDNANEKFIMLLSMLESDWPQIIDNGIFEVFRECFDHELTTKKKIDILMKITTPEDLLDNKTKRNILFTHMSASVAEELSALMGRPEKNNAYDFLLSIKYNSAHKKTVLNYFEITPKEKKEEITSCPTTVIQPISPLRSYQRQVSKDALKILSNDSRCLIHMPTGAGKTTTAMDIISEIMRKNEPSYIIWLAYSRELCSQAYDSLTEMWKKRGNREIKVYNLFGEKNIDFPNQMIDGVVICTLSKLLKITNKESSFLPMLSKKITAVVFDEAHQAIAPEYRFMVERIIENNEHCIFIGLTATPGRSWNKPEEDAELADYFHRNKAGVISDDGQSPMEMLTSEGYLSTIEWVTLEYKGNNLLNEHDKKSWNTILKTDKDIPDEIVRKLTINFKRNLRIVTCMNELINDRGMKRILVFAASVEHSRILSALFTECGYDSAFIDSQTDSEKRTTLINEFKTPSETPKILCNYNVLSTGVDIPNIDAGIIARPLNSVVLFSQMVGRMIRGPKTRNGTKNAIIATVVDVDLPGFKDTYELWINEWEK